MKINMIIFLMLTAAIIFVCEGCGGSSSSNSGSTCVANASCCSGTGYSNDGGTTCFHSSNCSSGCGGSSVTELKITNSIVDSTVGPNKALNENIGIKGVYPNSCTDCIQL